MFKIQYQNIVPTKEIKISVNEELRRLFELTPSDSICYAHILKYAEEYTSTLKIVGSVGQFFAQGRDTFLLNSIKNVEKKITQQLDHWKSFRFSEQGWVPKDVVYWEQTFKHHIDTNFTKSNRVLIQSVA